MTKSNKTDVEAQKDHGVAQAQKHECGAYGCDRETILPICIRCLNELDRESR